VRGDPLDRTTRPTRPASQLVGLWVARRQRLKIRPHLHWVSYSGDKRQMRRRTSGRWTPKKKLWETTTSEQARQVCQAHEYVDRQEVYTKINSFINPVKPTQKHFSNWLHDLYRKNKAKIWAKSACKIGWELECWKDEALLLYFNKIHMRNGNFTLWK